MLKLGGKVITIQSVSYAPELYSVSTNPLIPEVLRANKAFIVTKKNIPSGFAHYLIFDHEQHLINELPPQVQYTILSEDFSYLDDEDVIRLSRDTTSIKVLFRNKSPHNGLLITEQCNHYCLMCSQPPKDIDDSWIIGEVERLIPLIPRSTKELGFTGGEPTLFGQRFLDLLRLTKSYLPETTLHILSNGRAFKDMKFAENYASIQHPDMVVGIPLYSDDPSLHDYIVQAKGAFDETVLGILNLKKLNQRVEVRVVLHKLSIPRLKQLAEFIGRNLLFVDHVALMGLEMIGFTRANLDKLWIDPYEYKDTLSEAVQILSSYGLTTSVYNHQLCLVNHDIEPFYRKSISDWKNEYADECSDCLRRNECGGFFSSGIAYGYSNHITPFR
jgi:His-Xaa-Ser system radical SAM maturase HxsC